jgi:DNA-binding XRE family transcriptional regulator
MAKLSALRQYRDEADLSLQALALAIGVNKTTVRWWEKRGVPAGRLREVERVTGIPRHRLRPDLASLFSEAAE